MRRTKRIFANSFTASFLLCLIALNVSCDSIGNKGQLRAKITALYSTAPAYSEFVVKGRDFEFVRDFAQRNNVWNKQCAEKVQADPELAQFFEKFLSDDAAKKEAGSEGKTLSLDNINYNGISVREWITGQLGDVEMP